MINKNVSLLLMVFFMFSGLFLPGEEKAKAKEVSVNEEEGAKQLIVWTSGDREVALKMVFMYTFNAKKRGWWDEIRFVVWGPSSRLLSGDEELQKGIKEMIEAGVDVQACKACTDMYGVSDKLAALGIEVKYMGVPLTDMLKGGWTSLTF